MPATPHVEHHFTGSETIRDIVIGMSDGLTVPFALAAGLSGATNITSIIVTAGLAEVVAGSIAMGLGGYLAARTDSEHYQSERTREIKETEDVPEREKEEVAQIFRSYGLSEPQLTTMVAAIAADRRSMGRFYDAPRAWFRRTGREPGTAQRADDCRFLYRRRPDPAITLHAAPRQR